MKEIEFILPFENLHKKGEIKQFSRDIAYLFVNELKVAKYLEAKNKTKDKK